MWRFVFLLTWLATTINSSVATSEIKSPDTFAHVCDTKTFGELTRPIENYKLYEHWVKTDWFGALVKRYAQFSYAVRSYLYLFSVNEHWYYYSCSFNPAENRKNPNGENLLLFV